MTNVEAKIQQSIADLTAMTVGRTVMKNLLRRGNEPGMYDLVDDSF